MSAILTLSSVLLGIAVTAAPGVSVLGVTKMLEKFKEGKQEDLTPILTRFKDAELLKKTLEDCGYQTQFQEDGSVLMIASCGKVKFCKEEGEDIYQAIPIEFADTDELCDELEELNEEYMANIQTHTYRTLMKNLQKRSDLNLESEQVLEDDTILLTLTVE